MKSKILSILIMILCLQGYGQSVPNTNTFSLQDVVNVTGGTSLTAAFANATGTFDPAYVGSKNSLLNFRNYQNLVCPAIGSSYQGGVMAYLFVSGDPGYVSGECHGLIITASDLSTGMTWSNIQNVYVASTSLLIGSGLANTNLIIAQSGHVNSAAKICYDLVLNGYSDWYLPSYNELYSIHGNRTIIGGFYAGYYWASTDYEWLPDRPDLAGYSGTCANFSGGASTMAMFKSNSYHVRAIRSF